MTKEKERHNQANDLVEIAKQADVQNPVGLATDKSADSEEADDAKVSSESYVIPPENPTDDFQCVDNQRVYSEDDVQKLIEEAYLKGKNEAVKAQIGRDTAMCSDDASRRQVGLERYFVGRASVWR
ncbi:MAG: hypothetical protein E7079_03180 [Bacteroidales bacterium]|nr:hypothetical protein [Bacteroidales bacterium]